MWLEKRDIQKSLLTESALTLNKANDISLSMELAAKEAHQLSTSGVVHKVFTEDMKAKDKCYHCERTGPFAVDCWSKNL